MCRYSKDQACRGSRTARVLPGWELQEMVQGAAEWSVALLADRGEVVMSTAEVDCLARDWGVWPWGPHAVAEAARNPTNSSFFAVLGKVRGVPRAVVDKAVPTLFSVVGALVRATAISGLVNFNFKVRANGTPAIIEANVGRMFGDLMIAQPARLASLLLEYARRAGRCPPATAPQLAQEAAAAAEDETLEFPRQVQKVLASRPPAGAYPGRSDAAAACGMLTR
jgi:hypothetical protein